MVIGQFTRKENTVKIGTNLNIISDKLVQYDKQYVYGFEFEDVLQYDVELLLSDVNCNNSEGITSLDTETKREIEKWLFGRKQYAKFVIEDDDMDGLFYNAILLNPEVINVEGVVVGYKFTMVNDAPYAYTNNKKVKKSGLAGVTEFTVVNSSDKYGYTYPTLTFKLSAGDTLSIVNKSDNNREFKFEGISTEETITVDNLRQIITSSSGLPISKNFNKKFFRLKQNKNELIVTGDVELLNMEYEVCRQGAV